MQREGPQRFGGRRQQQNWRSAAQRNATQRNTRQRNDPSHPNTQELQRLRKMAGDRAVAAAKREAFEWKVNVLSGFDRPKDGGDKKAEL
jgi:hypothetical protein